MAFSTINKVRPIETYKHELRFYYNANDYNVLGTYDNTQLAYGMKNQFHSSSPSTYPLNRMKVVKVPSGRRV